MSSAPLGSLLPDVRVAPPGPASRSLAKRLRAVESRNVTYVDDDWPVFWEAAAGANVRDADGNVYVDLTGGFGVALLGHAHPAVHEAVQEQARSLVHGMGDVHPPSLKVRLLERLADLSPWPEALSVLASTGSEAVEVALKTAHLATGKPGVLALEGAYHGLTAGSLAVTWRQLFRAPFEARLYRGVAFAPFPVEEAGVEPALERVRRLLAEGAPNGDAVGAVIVEPVQGRAGVRLAAGRFMGELTLVAREAGALVIADELMTGAGRCGAWLASERVGLEPDLVCLGKALGAGLPLSACVGRRSVMDAWPESAGEAMHTSTFLGHPLACAAALGSLSASPPAERAVRTEAMGVKLRERLAERLSRLAGVVEVRGLGLLIGIELGVPGPRGAGAAVRVAAAALRRGLLVLPAGERGEVVELTPPVTLTDEQMDHAVEVLVSATREAL
jgi:4-aminobutyrate aminotransferase-like enzyme